jgi:Ca2+-binding EF-hand superfamily protein
VALALKAILSADASGFTQAVNASAERLQSLNAKSEQAAAGLAKMTAAGQTAAAAQQAGTAATERAEQAQTRAVAADRQRTEGQDRLSQAQREATSAQQALSAVNDDAEATQRRLVQAEAERRAGLERQQRASIQTAAAAQREVELLELMGAALRGATTADLERARALETRARQARDGAAAELQMATAMAKTTGDMQAVAAAAQNLRTAQDQLKGAQAASAEIAQRLRDEYVPLEAVQRRYAAELARVEDAVRAGIITEQEAIAVRQRLKSSHEQAEKAANANATGTSKYGAAAQNAGYQVGDFATQVASGQSALVAAAQQLPQLLGSFGMVGAIAGAGVALAAVAIKMAGVTSAAEKAEASTKRYEAALDALGPTLKEEQDRLDELIAKYNQATEARKKFWELDTKKAVEKDKKDIAALIRDLEAVTRAVERRGTQTTVSGPGIATVTLDPKALALASELRALLSSKDYVGFVERISEAGPAFRGLADDAEEAAKGIDQLTGNIITNQKALDVANSDIALLVELLDEIDKNPPRKVLTGFVNDNIADISTHFDELISKLPNAIKGLEGYNARVRAAEPFQQALAAAQGGTTAEIDAAARKLAVFNKAADDYGLAAAKMMVATGQLPPELQEFADGLERADLTKRAAETRQYADGLDRTIASMRLAAEAAGQGEAAQRAAAAANEVAAVSARDAAQADALRSRQAEMEALTVQKLAGERIAALDTEIAAANRMAAAVLAGSDAVRAAQIEERRLAAAHLYGAAATQKTTEEVEKYRQMLAALDRQGAAEAIAAQTREMDELNSTIAVERANLTASNRERKLAIAHQEALNTLAREGAHWTDEERLRWLANADAIAAARVEAEELAELRDTIDGIGENVAEAIYDGMTGKGDSIKDWFKNLFRRIAVEALKTQIVLPIVTSVVGSAPGLFGVGAAGGVTGGLSGLLNLTNGGGLASLVTGADKLISGVSGLFSGGGLSSLSGLFGGGGLSGGAYQLQSALFGQAGVRGTATSGLFGTGGTLFGSSTAAAGLSGALSGIGTGMMAGQVLGMLGIGKGNSTGSAIGGALGGAIGSIVPGVGTILGSIAGGALGSLFGNSKPSNKEGSAIIDLSSEAVQIGGFTGKKYSQENRDTAAAIADQVLSIKTALEKQLGAQISGSIAVGAGSRDGLFATALNSSTRTTFESSEAGMQQLVSYVTQQFVTGIQDQLAPEISAALGRVDFTDMEAAGADIDFITGFRDSLKALQGDMGLTDEVTAQATAQVQEQITAIQDFRDTAARLFPDAMAEVDGTLRTYVDGLIGVRDAAPAMTEVESGLAALEAQWKAYIPLMEEVGYSTAEAQQLMTDGLAKAKEAAKGDWVASMDAEFNSLIGNGFINDVRTLLTSRDTQYRNADALGADRSIVDRNINAALSGILTTDLRADQLQEVIRLFGSDFPEAAAVAQASLDKLTGAVEDTATAAAKATATNEAMDSLADRMAKANGTAETLNGALESFDRAAAHEKAAMQARVDAGEVSAEALTRTEEVLGAERVALAKSYADKAASVTRSLEDRAFALSVAGDPNAEIYSLERKQNAEFAAAQAAGYTAAQLELLVKVLAGEMIQAVDDLADAAREAAQAVNDNIDDRLFNATTDTSTLEGSLLAFDRQAAKDRAEAAKTAGADLVKLEEAIGLERNKLIQQFADAAAEALKAVNDNIADRLFNATTDTSTLEGSLAAFDRQAAKDRAVALETEGADLVSLEQAIAAERTAIIQKFADAATAAEEERLAALTQAGGTLRAWVDSVRATNSSPEVNRDTARSQFEQQLALAMGGNVDAVQGLSDYAQRLIDAETAYTASGSDRQAMVEAILAQVEAVPAVKSYDQQQLELLEEIAGHSADTAAAIQTLPAGATAAQIAEALSPSFQGLDTSLDGLLSFDELKAGLGGVATDEQLRALITLVDVNGDGMISAFELGLVDLRTAIQALPTGATAAQYGSAIAPFFSTLDASVNGLLSYEELKAGLGGLATDAQLAGIITELDTNGDGQLSALELVRSATSDLSGGGTGTLQALSDLTYAGNRDRLAIGDILNRSLVTLGSIMGGVGNIVADGNTRLSNLHAWQGQVWAVQSQAVSWTDKIRHNTAETARKLGGTPSYDVGTDNHPGGWAYVHQDEFVRLPGGAQVFTKAETLELARLSARRPAVTATSAGNAGDSARLAASIDRQARAVERQNALLERIAANTADGADAAAQTAAIVAKPTRVKVGSIAKLRRAG